LISLTSDPRVFIALLISAGIILGAGIFLLYRKKRNRIRTAVALASESSTETREDTAPGKTSEAAEPQRQATQGKAAPKFTTFQKRFGLGKDLLRALVILVSLVVASALLLTLLPQRAVDAMAGYLNARHRQAHPEKIALLYLGDGIIDDRFHIRGVVRNITAAPIEQLDAVVHFYAQDRSLLETAIVRMDKDTIAPNEIAQFELIYPSERPGFAGYSTEFKLRQGEMVPYKDLRKLPVQSK
jgi:hypothetical protein